jgi:hypothetical protein
MTADYDRSKVAEAKSAAIEVLLHNNRGPCNGLPRTAGWGYPEPYTRDLLLSAFGILVTGNRTLVETLCSVLETLAEHQSEHGHICSLVHDPEDRGASDTTPLFLVALSLYRKTTGEKSFLARAEKRARQWMEYQSPSDRIMVAQQPTSDWRDEMWVGGFGLYVNTLVYTYLRQLGEHGRADQLKSGMNRFAILATPRQRHVHEGLVLKHKPYYALWTYKIHNSERFDLLGNCLAILAGIATRTRSKALVRWVEGECRALRSTGDLSEDLPPNLFPFVRAKDPDWRRRYADYNKPGEYHNGGVWPFVCALYVSAIVAIGNQKLAEKKLGALTDIVSRARDPRLSFGFNEWLRAQSGRPQGQDWQTWSAALYLYAAACVEQGQTPFFDEVRGHSWSGREGVRGR